MGNIQISISTAIRTQLIRRIQLVPKIIPIHNSLSSLYTLYMRSEKFVNQMQDKIYSLLAKSCFLYLLGEIVKHEWAFDKAWRKVDACTVSYLPDAMQYHDFFKVLIHKK